MKNTQYLKIAILACAASVVISACNNTPTTTTTEKPSPVASTPPAASNEMVGMKHGDKKININGAILSELDKLEAKLGVPALSNKIQASRPYKTPEELVSKKVIDQAQYDQIKDLVTIEDVVLTGLDKDADYMVKLGLMKGHLYVAKELLDLNKPKDAEPHIGHPVEEIYTDVADQLNERKVKEFKTTLIALDDLVKAGAKEMPKVTTNLKESLQSIDTAIAALPETQRKNPAFVLRVINGLLDTANSEYGAAISDGKFKAAIEYQDSRGFITYADQLYQGIAATMAKDSPDAHKIIVENMKQLKTAWPAAIPPASPVKTPPEVGKLITAIEQSTQKVITVASK
ncbi:helix-hairpin-helix domain-containing protein [Chamaesiphon sp. GL140_3_metabinner_50]|uniref:ComEA family DNA-binding protein n=1 Tax=Chamaesiphon sp. GL140_3_metabinner_50 TaxID=2970812 RepID=UPI0025FF4C51|nr:helix-hairpin-helix domain-containing protein [Chamaesiphon sp. GL140_3_metabinner_50]